MYKYLSIVLLLCCCTVFSQVHDSIAIKTDSLGSMQNVERIFFNSKIRVNQEIYNKAFYNQQLIQESYQSTEQLQMKAARAIIGDKKEEDRLKNTVKNKDTIIKDPGEVVEIDRLIGPSQYDSRIEPLQLNEDIEWQKKILSISESIGILIEIEKLHKLSKTVFQLDISQKLGEVYRLCPGEAFYNQPVIGIGTAFVYSENTMLTALHVLERPIQKYVVVFGYKIINPNGVVNVFIDQDNIYYPKKIIKKNDNLDVVEFSVDRNFNRPVLEWENSKNIKKEESEIYMLGYPSGLPLKLAINASIIENEHPFYFYTSLDSFQGNSGSPVFNFRTNKIIGILVSGEIDYKFNGNCNYSPLCKYPYCKGEKVSRIEEVINQW